MIVNQLQFSIAHCPIIDAGLNVNIELNRLIDELAAGKQLP